MKFTASLRSELLKIKNTSVIYLILIAAFVIPFILFFDPPKPNQPADGWDQFYMQGMRIFVFIFLPLFFVLASTLLIQIEVRSNTWKQVLASPQSFFHILLAKFAVLQLLSLAFILIYNLYMILSAAMLDAMYGLNTLSYLEHKPELVKVNLMAYVSTVGISSLSFWLALRSKNFIAPIAIGFLLWFIELFAVLEFRWPYVDKFVLAIPLNIFSRKVEQVNVFHQLLLSIGYCVIFFGIAYLEFVMKRMKVGTYLRRNIFVRHLH